MLKFGHITNIDEYGRVIVEDDETGFKTDYIPVVVGNAEKDNSGNTIDINAFVAVILDDKNPMNGVCLGAVNTNKRPSNDIAYKTFSDGTHYEYDRENHILKADIKGLAHTKANKVLHEGDLYVLGNIFCSDNISDRKGTIQSIRDWADMHKHTNGNNGANTGTPTERING